MKQSDIQNVIRSIVLDLIDKSYQRVHERDYGKRLTEHEIKEGVEDRAYHLLHKKDPKQHNPYAFADSAKSKKPAKKKKTN